jgi:hypothetical protein
MRIHSRERQYDAGAFEKADQPTLSASACACIAAGAGHAASTFASSAHVEPERTIGTAFVLSSSW